MQITEQINDQGPRKKDYKDRWEGHDQGLIAAWQAGQDMAYANPAMAAAALRGELPILPFKGGVERPIKRTDKPGAFHYLAMWQGLRGEDLCIDTDNDLSMVCTKHRVPITFTSNLARLLAAESEAEQ